MEELKVKCYAKINLFLNATQKGNTHHEIQSLMHSISLCDELVVSKKKVHDQPTLSFVKGESPEVAIKTPDYDLTKNNLLEKVHCYFRRVFFHSRH